MATIELNSTILSDLVLHEARPAEGYARLDIFISDNDAEIPMGTVVARDINNTDQTAPFAVAAVGDLVDTKEFAVVFGDKFGCKEVFTTDSEDDTKAVAFVRGEVQLKDELLMESLEITDRDSANYKALKALLEKQGIIIEETLGYPAV